QINNAYEINGPVKMLRLEIAKVKRIAGQDQEGPRRVVEESSYDTKFKRTDQKVNNADGSFKFKYGWRATYDDRGRATKREFFNDKGVRTCFATYEYGETNLNSATPKTVTGSGSAARMKRRTSSSSLA